METNESTQQLPDLPSELLRLALSDLRKCEQDPTFRIDMGVWLLPAGVNTLFERSYDQCSVCLAGSVMAQTLKHPLGLSGGPRDWRFDTASKLYALNYFRTGIVVAAYVWLRRSRPKEIPSHVPVCRYDQDKEMFHKDMDELVHLLETHGE